jgi:hypothetical protein
MSDCENDDFAALQLKYDAPISDPQAHRRIAF